MQTEQSTSEDSSTLRNVLLLDNEPRVSHVTRQWNTLFEGGLACSLNVLSQEYVSANIIKIRHQESRINVLTRLTLVPSPKLIHPNPSTVPHYYRADIPLLPARENFETLASSSPKQC